MKGLLTLGFVAQGLRISVPYVLAALGGTLSERSGVINIALEGFLLAGAFAAALVARETGSALLGIAAGCGAGLLLAAIYGLAVIRFRADQIVCGVAATLIASGATRFFLKLVYHSSSNSPRIPALASTLPLLLATVALAFLVHALLFGSRLGLRLRAAGEHPEAAISLGVQVPPLRWWGVLASGLLGGMGGVWLAFDQHQFVAGMSAGRGFVALAAMILGGWRPLWGAAACLVFGFAEAVELQLQASALPLAPGTVQSIPYLITILALVLRPRGGSAPKALGKPLGDG